ncbi:hypothetical protein TrLO_g15963 [Triparma laevis f. longispina]|uniref:Tyrosine-protein kinase ephrin type A/B receptor-like domain-containing protein n=1 Tax=Triparma laevis f. longispina TaxID=1714387 RepID=A0A9W6ZF80_9STRA|nr:hypothetical protein TrLO_g15963 [Triparma laevis f. longispina]
MQPFSLLLIVGTLVVAFLSYSVLADCSGAKNVVEGSDPSCNPGCIWIANPIHDEAAPGDFCDYQQRDNNYDCYHTEYRSCDCIDTVCWNQPANYQSYCSCRKEPESCGKGCSGQTEICSAKMEEREVDSKCKSSDKPCNYETGPANPANLPCTVLDCHKQYTCTGCEMGKWSASGKTECTDCVKGKYGAIEMMQSAQMCTDCVAGKFADETGQYQCEECDYGTYQDDQAGELCKICPAGRYQDEKGQDDCITCPAGKFISDGDELSGVSAAAHLNEQACTLCPDGHYNDGTQPVGSCTKCEAGKKSNGDRDSCDECPDGKYSGPSPGWHFCAQCGSGKYSDAATGHASCTNAPNGAYAVGEDQKEYTVCGAGEWSTASSSSTGPTSCTKCEAGKYISDDAKTNPTLHESVNLCLPCPSGQKAPDLGASSCEACPAGRYQSASDFTDCYACDPGKYTSTTTGHTSCQICGAGLYSNSNTAGSCESCQEGKYIVDPATNHALHAGEASCIECAEDFYNNQVGQTQCVACEGGTTQGETGATECGSCTQGKTARSGVDENGDPATGCDDCTAGKYSNSKTGFLCQDCEAGRYGTTGGMGGIPINQVDNAEYTVCDRCDAGKISVAGSSSEDDCTNCAAGKYAILGDITCTNCDQGKYSPAGSNNPISDCKLCTSGKYSAGTATAGNGAGSTVEEGCTSCEVGKAQNTWGSAECTWCLSGQYSPKADIDSGGIATANFETCGLCPGGKTSVQPNAETVIVDGSGIGVCVDCPDGRSSNEGEDVCYKVATQFDTCETYDTPVGTEKKIKNECTYLYAGHWTTKEEGTASPFGASCKSYSVCGSEHQKDSLDAFKRDEYFIVCDECADGYEPAAAVPELLTGWDDEITDLLTEATARTSLENCQGTAKPTVCYKKEDLKQCIETSDEALLETPKADIDCEYYFQGGWIAKDPTNVSPFGDTCGNYTICGFDQTSSTSIEFDGQTVNVLPKDTYKIMCDNCYDRYSTERPKGYIGGLTAKDDVFTDVPEGGNSLSSKGVCSAGEKRPGICYDSSNGFNSCPTFPSAETNPFEQFLPGSMFGQECKYMYNDQWREVESGEFSQFNTTCKEYELCAVEEGTTTTTYKVACSECANNFLPAFPSRSSGIGSQEMGTCTNDYYPSMCYAHVNPEINGADWQTCPYSPYQNIKCRYWLDGEWIEKSSGQASPWAGKCGEFKVCNSEIEGDIENDVYNLFCTRCGYDYFPKRLEKPEGSDAVGQCGDMDFTKDLRSLCEIRPTPSPTPVPTSSFRPPENPTDGGGDGDGGDEDEGDDYTPPSQGNNDDQDFEQPDSLTDKIKAAVGGDQSANIVIGGAIVLCFMCGACIMKTGCKCCGSSVEYDSDDDEDEYGFEDDETRGSEYTTNSEYTSGSGYDDSSKYSRSSSSASNFEQYNNPMRGAQEKLGKGDDGLLHVRKG